jgi:hypothetical protein
MIFLDLSSRDRATVQRSMEIHAKQLEEAVARIHRLERSDMDLKIQQGHLLALTKDFELKAKGAGKGDYITLELPHPLRMALATGLRILRYEAVKLGDRSIKVIGSSDEASREIDHIDRLLDHLQDQTALELGAPDEKPVAITQEGVADIRGALDKGIHEAEEEPPTKRKKRERAVLKEQKQRERNVLDENRP